MNEVIAEQYNLLNKTMYGQWKGAAFSNSSLPFGLY